MSSSPVARGLPAPDAAPFEAAQVYIAHGWAVVPCCSLVPGTTQCTGERGGIDSHDEHGKPDTNGKLQAGKVPVAKWKGRAATTPDEAAKWWRRRSPNGPNVALLMGPGGLLAFDVDGPTGEATIAAAALVLGTLPPTLENVTGRADGGRHLVFRVPDDASDGDIATLTKSCASLVLDPVTRRFIANEAAGTGLDLRAGDRNAGRSYIMVAPSVHASGRRYQWRGTFDDIAMLPEAWFAALPRASVATATVIDDGAQLPLGAAGHEVERDRVSDVDAMRERYRLALDAALSDLCRTVREAPDGTQNNALRDASLRAFRLALGTGDAHLVDDAGGAMLAAAIAGKHPAKRAEKTIASSRDKAMRDGPATLRERPKTARSSSRPSASSEGGTNAPEDQVENDEHAPDLASTALPVIRCGLDLRRVVNESIDALASHPDVYQGERVGLVRIVTAPALPDALARRIAAAHEAHRVGRELTSEERAAEREANLRPPPGAPIVEALPLPTLTEQLTTVATFERYDRRAEEWRQILPPPQVVSTLADRKVYPTSIRPLAGIIEMPSMRPDGTVIVAPGYDVETGLYLRPYGRLLEMPERPTRDDARDAYKMLARPFADFRFQGDKAAQDAARAACVAAILTVLSRRAINGPVPGFVFEADRPNAGKTLVANVCGIVATGRAPAVRQYTDDDDEMSKRLGAIAQAGGSVALFDNIHHHIAGGMLELVLTAVDRVGLRILGSSDDREFLWRTVLLLTANKASFSPDMARRFLRVLMYSRGTVGPGEEPGTTARTFAFPDLIGHVRENRTEYLHAALVILRAHALADRPDAGGSTIDTFEAWSRIVAHAVTWASDADPARTKPAEGDDRDTDLAQRLVALWCAAAPGETLTVAAMLDRCKAANVDKPGAMGPAKVEALAELRATFAELADVPNLDHGRATPDRLGRRLGMLVQDRQFPAKGGGHMALATGENRNHVKTYTATTDGAGVAGGCGGSGQPPRAKVAGSLSGDGGATGATLGGGSAVDPPQPPDPPHDEVNTREVFDA